MNIALFDKTQIEEANTFAKFHEVSQVQYDFQTGEIAVFYTPKLTVEEARQKRIQDDEHKATTEMAVAEMHLEFLEEVSKHDKDADEKIKGAIENTQQNIRSYKSALAMVEKWKAEHSSNKS